MAANNDIAWRFVLTTDGQRTEEPWLSEYKTDDLIDALDDEEGCMLEIVAWTDDEYGDPAVRNTAVVRNGVVPSFSDTGLKVPAWAIRDVYDFIAGEF